MGVRAIELVGLLDFRPAWGVGDWLRLVGHSVGTHEFHNHSGEPKQDPLERVCRCVGTTIAIAIRGFTTITIVVFPMWVIDRVWVRQKGSGRRQSGGNRGLAVLFFLRSISSFTMPDCQGQSVWMHAVREAPKGLVLRIFSLKEVMEVRCY